MNHLSKAFIESVGGDPHPLTCPLVIVEGSISLPPKATPFHPWPVEIVGMSFSRYPAAPVSLISYHWPCCPSLKATPNQAGPLATWQSFKYLKTEISSWPPIVQVNGFLSILSRNLSLFAFDDCTHKTLQLPECVNGLCLYFPGQQLTHYQGEAVPTFTQ